MFFNQLRAYAPNLLAQAVGLAFLMVCFVSCISSEMQNKQTQRHLPKVVSIYPTSDSLPENLLRFYVEFSHSMKTVRNLENIKLLNDKGEEIKGAIFNNVYELWDSEQKQLTLILDPARVKTGLVANESLGRALQPNQHYQLVIEKAEDINGNLLEKKFVKDFFVTKEDVVPPKIENWDIILPKKSSHRPLKIKFPQMLDRLSLINRIWLTDYNGEIVKGSIEISHQQKQWAFIPNKKWTKGIYFLYVNGRLEDPAGNNLNGLFDHRIGSLKEHKEGEINKIKLLIK